MPKPLQRPAACVVHRRLRNGSSYPFPTVVAANRSLTQSQLAFRTRTRAPTHRHGGSRRSTPSPPVFIGRLVAQRLEFRRQSEGPPPPRIHTQFHPHWPTPSSHRCRPTTRARHRTRSAAWERTGSSGGTLPPSPRQILRGLPSCTPRNFLPPTTSILHHAACQTTSATLPHRQCPVANRWRTGKRV
jgi:hypothetical protein